MIKIKMLKYVKLKINVKHGVMKFAVNINIDNILNVVMHL